MKKRIQDAAWLVGQIKQLAKDAADNAKEDTERAKVDSSRRDIHEVRADTERFYAKELRRILRGLTWQEDFRKRVK